MEKIMQQRSKVSTIVGASLAAAIVATTPAQSQHRGGGHNSSGGISSIFGSIFNPNGNNGSQNGNSGGTNRNVVVLSCDDGRNVQTFSASGPDARANAYQRARNNGYPANTCQ